MENEMQYLNQLQSIELFAGAGGLELGFSLNDVGHQTVVKWDHCACDTLRNNKRNSVKPVAHWADVTEADVRNFSYAGFEGLDLVTGGPPCQPFSMGGKARGFLNHRYMFYIAFVIGG